MITIRRTNSENPDFTALVKLLDSYLAEVDGDDHAFYAQFNKTNKLKCVVLAYENDTAIGCGAIRPFNSTTMEVKRMYTDPGHRGKGIASMILSELETWARELNCSTCILETGKRQPEAIALYKKKGYKIIPNYGQYGNMENSVCFEKKIIQS